MASERNGVGRILAKLEKRLIDGEFYEAHQLYRTLYFRYCSQNRYDEAINLLMDGSLALLNANQISSGADLALLLVNTLEKSKAPFNKENMAKVSRLHKLIERDHIERQNFVQSALRWSSKNGPTTATTGQPTTVGQSTLHAQFALNFWQEKDYPQARYHFIRSEDGEGCATMLVEYHITFGYPSEVDLFIAQTVFQFLCLRNKLTAETCFNCYTKQHPQVERGPPFIRPLLNFLWMLLLAVDGGNLAVFTILCEQYRVSLTRDPNYNDYLDKIGQLFFQVPPPRPSGAGMFGNLLSNLFAYDEDGQDDRTVNDPSPVELD